MMPARIEFEREWLPKFKGKNNLEKPKESFTLNGNKQTIKNKALGSIRSEGLKNMLDKL